MKTTELPLGFINQTVEEAPGMKMKAKASKEPPQLCCGSPTLPGHPSLGGHLPDAFTHPDLCYDEDLRVLFASSSSPSWVGHSSRTGLPETGSQFCCA